MRRFKEMLCCMKMSKTNVYKTTKDLEVEPSSPLLTEMAKDPDTSLSDIENNIESFSNGDWIHLSKNKNLTMEFVEKHLDKLWCWGELSGCLPLTIEFVERHFNNRSWNFGSRGFSSNPSITLEFIDHFPSKNWDYGLCGLSNNLNITEEFVERHLDVIWCWWILADNPNISREFVERYIDKSEMIMLKMV